MAYDHTSALSGLNPLYVVLEHLSGPGGDHQQYRKAAGGLRLASKQYHAAAKATLRQLRLYKYWRGVQSAYPDPGNPHSLLPWSLLAAHPTATSWQLCIQQLEGLTPDEEQQLAAAAGGLKQLVVYQARGRINGCGGRDSFGYDPSNPSDAQQQALGRLLRACRRLEEVELYCTISKPWLVLDPNSSSLSSATVPPLILRSWKSTSVPHTLLTTWVQQQRGLTDTLRSVRLRNAGPKLDAADLAILRGLQQLHLEDERLVSPTHLTRMTSLTGLHVIGSGSTARAACTLTGLRDLKLFLVEDSKSPHFASPPPLCALKQVTSFNIRYGDDDQAHMLVEQLQGLEAWEASHLSTRDVPSSLTRLSRLTASHYWRPGQATLTLPSSLTRLKQLTIYPSRYTSIQGLSNMTGLELLELPTCIGLHSTSAASSLAALQPLTSLRHLSFGLGLPSDMAGVAVLQALQRLTYLSIAYSTPSGSARGAASEVSQETHHWPLSEPLVALQQLQLHGFKKWCMLSSMCYWLVRLTALTALQAENCVVEGGGEPLRLPEQLEVVHLSGGAAEPSQLPCCLQELPALRCLRVCNLRLQQLPSWLSVLRRLEALDLSHTGVVTEQPVLTQLPALRCVGVPWHASGVVVYGRATHLHFGDVGCLHEYGCVVAAQW